MALIAPPTLQLNITLKQGTDATINITVVGATGTPITNPAGYTITAQIRTTPTGPVLFEWNTTPGSGFGAASLTYSPVTLTSTLALVVTAAESALFTFASAQWDCVLTNPSGQVTCLAEGVVTIDQLITH